MNNPYTLGDLGKHIIKKWKIILTITLITAILIPSFKLITQERFHSCKYQISGMIEYDNHGTYQVAEGVTDYLNYAEYWVRNPILAEFYLYADSAYDMEKFSSNWDKDSTTDAENLQWLRNQLVFNPVSHTPSYEVNFSVIADAEDREYVEDNIENFLKDFLVFAGESVKSITPKSSYRIKEIALQENNGESLENKISFKYAIIGAMLGGILSVMIALISFFATKYVPTPSWFASYKKVHTFQENPNNPYMAFTQSIMLMNALPKRVVSILSSVEDIAFAEEYINQFSKYQYKTLFVNLTDQQLNIPQNIITANKHDINILNTPGKVEQHLKENLEYDYIVFLLPYIEKNPHSLEVVCNSTVAIVKEELNVSKKNELTNFFDKVEKNSDIDLLLVW